MGNNQAYIQNETGDSLRCLTFNNSDTVYWIPRAYLTVPAGERTMADGLQGGGAVKVGVVYREDLEEGTSHFDLFQVSHEATLIIKEVNEEGVREFFTSGGQVRLLWPGMSIRDPNVQLQAQDIIRGLH